MDSTPSNQAAWFVAKVQPHLEKLRAYLLREFPGLPDVRTPSTAVFGRRK